MFKILAFLTKRADLDDAQFVDYYENRHIPFVMGLAPGPTLYKRRYLKRGTEMEQGNGSVDFDVVTEVGFPDRAAFETWMAEGCFAVRSIVCRCAPKSLACSGRCPGSTTRAKRRRSSMMR